MSEFTFTKGERLSSRKAITELFQKGREQVSTPVRILYQVTGEGECTASMAVSIPKRLFKRAVDRNLLKRRIREIYRLYKPVFYDQLNRAGIKLQLVIQYQKTEIVGYDALEKGVRRGLNNVLSDLTG
jgi:ribonuclease P protein component